MRVALGATAAMVDPMAADRAAMAPAILGTRRQVVAADARVAPPLWMTSLANCATALAAMAMADLLGR